MDTYHMLVIAKIQMRMLVKENDKCLEHKIWKQKEQKDDYALEASKQLILKKDVGNIKLELEHH